MLWMLGMAASRVVRKCEKNPLGMLQLNSLQYPPSFIPRSVEPPDYSIGYRPSSDGPM